MRLSHQARLQTIGYRTDRLNVLLWVNVQFLYKRTDYGRTWFSTVSQQLYNGWTSRGIDNAILLSIAPSAADDNLVYSYYADLGVWLSDIQGTSWISIKPDPICSDVVWAHMAGDLLEGDPSHLRKIMDRGSSWTEYNVELPASPEIIESLVLNPNSSITARWVYVVAYNDVYQSRNNDFTWDLALEFGACSSVRYTEGGFIAFGSIFVHRSWRDGVPRSWEDITLPSSVTEKWKIGRHWCRRRYQYNGSSDLAWKEDGQLWLAVVGYSVIYSPYSGQIWTTFIKNPFIRSVTVYRTTGALQVGSSSSVASGGFKDNSLGVLEHVNVQTASGWLSQNEGLSYPFALRF